MREETACGTREQDLRAERSGDPLLRLRAVDRIGPDRTEAGLRSMAAAVTTVRRDASGLCTVENSTRVP
jgi:hypothetical protein